VANRIERWRARRKATDTLEMPPDTATLENQCPSIETTPSSI
jgi:hypothetical protein